MRRSLPAAIIAGSTTLVEVGLTRVDAPGGLMILTGVLGLACSVAGVSIFRTNVRRRLFVGFLLLYGLFSVWVVGRTLHPPAVFVSCAYDKIPAVVPPEGRVHALIIGSALSGDAGNGLEEYLGSPGGALPWAKNFPGLGMGYRCEVTNDAAGAMLNVSIPVHLTFRAPLPVSTTELKFGRITWERDWTVPIPRIDAGPRERFVFYMWNCCVDQFVAVSLPTTISAEFNDGTRTRRRVRVAQPDHNLAVPLFPIRVHETRKGE